MKTIKDVIAAYPDGWPNGDKCNLNAIGYNSRDDLFFTCLTPMYEFINVYEYFICTREEYEQALRESKVESKCDWYDYDKQEWNGKNIPPIGLLVLLNGVTVSVVLHDNKILNQVCVRHQNGELSIPKVCWLKPLDHDKHKVKTVSLDWLVDSGIDCEFSDGGNGWCVSELNWFGDDWYQDNFLDRWKQCRPRQSHPMVLTDEQVKLIPDGFDYDSWRHSKRDCYGIFYIATFKGLKDGYKYDWEE
jgi:hypothetical protein